MNTIRILIADDHAVVRMGLSALFGTETGLEVVGMTKNGDEAVRETIRLRPDVVVMDLMMPKKDGAKATRDILERLPTTKVVILTSFATSDGIAQALKAGAVGAVMKSAENAELVSAIRKVAAGNRYVSPEIRNLIASDPPISDLSDRQYEVLHSLSLGLTNKDIARQLDISERCVEVHIDRLLSKIGAANRTEAVAIALRKHLLRNPPA